MEGWRFSPAPNPLPTALDTQPGRSCLCGACVSGTWLVVVSPSQAGSLSPGIHPGGPEGCLLWKAINLEYWAAGKLQPSAARVGGGRGQS